MTNIKNNLEKEVNRISSEWTKILYGEDKGVKMKEIKQNPIFKIKEGEDLSPLLYTFNFNKNEEFEQREQSVKEKLIKALENTDITTIEPVELDYEYLLGFYEGITRKAPPLNISFENLKGFYDAIQLICKVHLKDKK